MERVEVLEKVAYIDPPGTLVDERSKPEVAEKPDTTNHYKQDDS